MEEEYGQFVIIDIHVTRKSAYRTHIHVQPEIIEEVNVETKENEIVSVDLSKISVDHLWLNMLCTFLDCI
jgi:hypothetical protein